MYSYVEQHINFTDFLFHAFIVVAFSRGRGDLLDQLDLL